MQRVLSALLVGLGVALMVGGWFAPSFLLFDARLPLSIGQTTWTLHDPDGLRDGQPAPVTRQLHMEIREPSDASTASVRVGDTLRAGDAGADFDNLVSASTWAFEMNRKTGRVKDPAQVQLVMGMPAVEVPVEGLWLSLGTGVTEQTYEVFDPVLRGSAPAEFVGAEEVAGRTVHRFRQVIEPTNLAQRYADLRNTGYEAGPDGEPVKTYLFYAAERELTVDQVTGLVVGVDEKVDQYYGDAAGRGLRNVVLYDAAMDPDQVAANVEAVAGVRSESHFARVTWIVFGVGAVLTVLGLVGVWRGSLYNRGRVV